MPNRKKSSYVLFCSNCGIPQPIPNFILQAYFISGVDGVYCINCENKTVIPDYIKKLKNDL